MTRYLCLFVLGLVALTNCDKVDDFFKDYYDWKSGQKQFVDIAKSSNDIKKAVE